MKRDWWWFAKEDLAIARLLLREERHLDGVTFHCQQAVEKMLKGAIGEDGRTPPRIHALEELLDVAVEIAPDCESLRKACRIVDRYYTPSRYPDSWMGAGSLGVADLTEATEALRLAEETWRFFEKRRGLQVKEPRAVYGRRRSRR